MPEIPSPHLPTASPTFDRRSANRVELTSTGRAGWSDNVKPSPISVLLMRAGVPSHNALRETEIVAKRKNIGRTRAKARSEEVDVEKTGAITLTARQLEVRRQRWRALKQQFDRAHHAGMTSLKRRDYRSLRAAILHERHIIDELRVLIDEARAQIG